MHIYIVSACPIETPPSHRNPRSAKSAELSVGNCHKQCSIRRWPWKSALFQCKGGYRYFNVDVETKERPRKIPFFLKCDNGGPHSTRRE